jgi:amidase
LDARALNGARVGVARDFMGTDGEVDWVIDASLEAMRNAGATVVEVRFPEWFLEARGDLYTTIRWPEFRAQIAEYLATLGPEYPKTLEDLVAHSMQVTSPTSEGAQPNPPRWSLMQREEASGRLTDPEYVAVHEHGMPMVRALIEGIMDADSLDAIVYPTSPNPPDLIEGNGGGGGPSPVNLANLSGFPDLIVPAGFTSDRLPVGISFLGRAFSEPQLLAIGYAFEQATKARRDPVYTPPLPGEGTPR